MVREVTLWHKDNKVVSQTDIAAYMKKILTNIGGLVGVRNDGVRLLKGAAMAELDVVKQAWLEIEDDRITGYGRMEDLSQIGAGVEEVDVREGWVLPALCDPHTHLVFAESREAEFVDKLKGMTYEEIAARGGGILNSAAKLQQMDESELFDQSLARLKAVEDAGIGAIEIKSGYGLTVADELKMLRVIQRLKAHSPLCIKSTFLALHAVPSAYRGKKVAFVELMVHELLPRVAAEGLADFVDVFCEKNYFDIEDMVRVIEAGQNHGLRAKVHVNQFNSFGGIQAAVAAHALSVDHLEVMTAADIDALRGSETIPTVLPGCSFYLRIPYAPARAMIDAGLPVAIASDFNPGSAPSYNPELNISMACIQQRLLPEEAINAATLNAAAAMDVSSDFGSIEKKKKANIVLTRPLPSLAYLPYAFGEKKISRLMLNGSFC